MTKPNRALLDVNRASREQLIALNGVGESLADSIRSHRPYESISDLEAVRGISARNVRSLRAQGLMTTTEIEHSTAAGGRSDAVSESDESEMEDFAMDEVFEMFEGADSMPGEKTMQSDAMDVTANTNMTGAEFEMMVDIDDVELRIAAMSSTQPNMSDEPSAGMQTAAMHPTSDDMTDEAMAEMTSIVMIDITDKMIDASFEEMTQTEMTLATTMGEEGVMIGTDGTGHTMLGSVDSLGDRSEGLLDLMPGELASTRRLDAMAHGATGVSRANGTELAEFTGTFRLTLSL
jgi:hypothetical protein